MVSYFYKKSKRISYSLIFSEGGFSEGATTCSVGVSSTGDSVLLEGVSCVNGSSEGGFSEGATTSSIGVTLIGDSTVPVFVSPEDVLSIAGKGVLTSHETVGSDGILVVSGVDHTLIFPALTASDIQSNDVVSDTIVSVSILNQLTDLFVIRYLTKLSALAVIFGIILYGVLKCTLTDLLPA